MTRTAARSPAMDIAAKIREARGLLPHDIPGARVRAEPLAHAHFAAGAEGDQADLYHLIGLIEFYAEAPVKAIKWFNKELRLREKLGDKKGASDILNNLGAIYYQRGKLDIAREYYQRSLTYRLEINDRRGIAGAYENIGGVMLKQGMASSALEMNFKALAINQALGDEERAGISLQNIGNVYYTQGDYDYALKNYKESLAIANKSKDKPRAVQLMINIGSVFVLLHNTAEAKKYFRKCYEESTAIDYKHGLVLSLHSLAEIEFDKGRYRECIRQHMECIRIAESTGYRSELIYAMMAVGRSYTMLHDHAQALRYLHDALVLARRGAFKDKVSEIYRYLSETYEQLNDYKKALEYYRRHIALRNELVNKDTTRTITEIKTRYEVEKKEKEAELLKEKNEAIRLYAHRLEVSNNELKQFAHVASHDLREPLRMVSSYMGLLQRSLHDLTPDQQQFIAFAIDGAKRMEALIHDLLRLAKVDADPQIERVPLSGVVEEVRLNLQVLLREKNAQITSTRLPDIMADRTQVTQLLQNIIGNGIKYNEHKRPTVKIAYRTEGTAALLSIADNGIGIPPEHRERAFRIFQRIPTARVYQGSGIGLAICKKIVDGMGGTISIGDNEGGGTVFHISIPLSLVC